jgi:hypothetical protein
MLSFYEYGLWAPGTRPVTQRRLFRHGAPSSPSTLRQYLLIDSHIARSDGRATNGASIEDTKDSHGAAGRSGPSYFRKHRSKIKFPQPRFVCPGGSRPELTRLLLLITAYLGTMHPLNINFLADRLSTDVVSRVPTGRTPPVPLVVASSQARTMRRWPGSVISRFGYDNVGRV